jgi:hypothetical protein
MLLRKYFMMKSFHGPTMGQSALTGGGGGWISRVIDCSANQTSNFIVKLIKSDDKLW